MSIRKAALAAFEKVQANERQERRALCNQAFNTLVTLLQCPAAAALTRIPEDEPSRNFEFGVDGMIIRAEPYLNPPIDEQGNLVPDLVEPARLWWLFRVRYIDDHSTGSIPPSFNTLAALGAILYSEKKR